MKNFFYSPYGVLPGEYKEKGDDRKVVMNDWRPDLKLEDRIATFNAWRQDRLAEYTETIWPAFDPASDTWSGGAMQIAKGLTAFEVDVMIREYLGDPKTLNEVPRSALEVPNMPDHHHHYVDEDTEAPGFNYRHYDRTLGSREEELFLYRMRTAITTKAGVGDKAAGHFWFKAKMQRPRPLHAALRLNLEKHFESELSERGQHPSIVSGHCFQGIMMCCAVLEEWLDAKAGLDPRRKDSLAQYMVDMGDRRVFAGVHYPSDNIASWALSLALIPEVFKDPATISAFVIDAVMTKSAVYKTIVASYTSEASAAPAMGLLAKYNLVAPPTSKGGPGPNASS